MGRVKFYREARLGFRDFFGSKKLFARRGFPAMTLVFLYSIASLRFYQKPISSLATSQAEDRQKIAFFR